MKGDNTLCGVHTCMHGAHTVYIYTHKDTVMIDNYMYTDTV